MSVADIFIHSLNLVQMQNSNSKVEPTTESGNSTKLLVSHSALLVLNYLKKHNCKIEFYWWCGIQQYKVVVNGVRKNYPRINEEIWHEIKTHLVKCGGEYQTGETWSLHCG